MTLYESLKIKRDNELLKAAQAAADGDRELVNFHSAAAAGFLMRLTNASVEELEQSV